MAAADSLRSTHWHDMHSPVSACPDALPRSQVQAAQSSAVPASLATSWGLPTAFSTKAPLSFHFQELLEMEKPKINYRKVSSDYVSTIHVNGKTILQVRESCVGAHHKQLLAADPPPVGCATAFRKVQWPIWSL